MPNEFDGVREGGWGITAMDKKKTAIVREPHEVPERGLSKPSLTADKLWG